jgi:alpha-galactosidase
MKPIRYTTLLLAAAIAAAAQNPTGRWIAKASPGDDVLEIVLALNVTPDGAVAGYVQAPQYTDRIVEGSAKDGALTFTGEREGNNGKMERRTYTATVEGDKLKLTLPTRANQPPRVLEFARVSSDAPKALPPDPPKIGAASYTPVKYNGLAKTPPMGWNSWNKFQRRVNDQVVREIADALVSTGMKDAGYIYVNIDDTWEGTRDEHGNIRSNAKFPDMKRLVDYVHGKGLKIGIYSSPGPKTCAGYEGSFQHEEQDAKTYAAWGMDYLKYDWCSAPRVYEADAMQGAYAKMGEALLHSGRDIVYSLCQYGMQDVGEWGAKVGGNLWRTTGDISDRWPSMENLGFKLQVGREKFANPGHWNDPDMLEVGNGGMTDDEYRTHMSLWSLLAAPLLAGNDLREMKPAILEILTNKEVIAVDQDALGKQGMRVSQDGSVEVWSRTLADGGLAVGLFNRGAASAKVAAKWSDLGISGAHSVRNLWDHKDLGPMDEAFIADVPSHGVVLVHVAK